MMDIIQAIAKKNLCYISGKKMKPAGILVHSTGANNPNLKRYVDAPAECGVNQYNNHWNNPKPEGYKMCVHAFIGYDKNMKVRTAQLLPWDMICWGCGKGSKGSFNYEPNAHIQFEICEDGLTDKTYFNAVWAESVELCAYLCKQYKLDPLGKNVIVSHNEAGKMGYASGHGDPDHWFKKHGKTMDDFRKAVKSALGGSASTSNSKTMYTVQVGAFKEKKNADGVAAQLKVKGFAAMVKQSGGLYCVQAGAFSSKANAQRLREQLKAKGYAAIIKTN